jgi:hypothetical protein
LLAGSLCLAACAPKDAGGLSGTYVAAYSSAKVQLALSADGRFTQSIDRPDRGAQVVSRGTWLYSAPSHRVTFWQLRSLSNPECGSTLDCTWSDPGTASLTVERHWGIGALQMGVEFDHPYIRQYE